MTDRGWRSLYPVFTIWGLGEIIMESESPKPQLAVCPILVWPR